MESVQGSAHGRRGRDCLGVRRGGVAPLLLCPPALVDVRRFLSPSPRSHRQALVVSVRCFGIPEAGREGPDAAALPFPRSRPPGFRARPARVLSPSPPGFLSLPGGSLWRLAALALPPLGGSGGMDFPDRSGDRLARAAPHGPSLRRGHPPGRACRGRLGQGLATAV